MFTVSILLFLCLFFVLAFIFFYEKIVNQASCGCCAYIRVCIEYYTVSSSFKACSSKTALKREKRHCIDATTELHMCKLEILTANHLERCLLELW